MIILKYVSKNRVSSMSELLNIGIVLEKNLKAIGILILEDLKKSDIKSVHKNINVPRSRNVFAYAVRT